MLSNVTPFKEQMAFLPNFESYTLWAELLNSFLKESLFSVLSGIYEGILTLHHLSEENQEFAIWSFLSH